MARRIPYQLTIKQRRGYLCVEYGGTGLTLESILDMIHLSAQAVRTQNATRVLLIRNMPLFTSDADRRLIASIIKKIVSPGVRYAMVDKFGNDAASSEKGLAVLNAEGWNIREFPTVKEAEDWLTSQ